MRSFIRRLVACSAVGLAGTAGATVVGGAHAAPRAEAPADAPAQAPHEFVQLIGEALGEVSLRPDQLSVVRALGEHIEPLQARVDAAEVGILNTLAANVRAGHIDRTALESHVTDYVNARVDVSIDLRDAIGKLHAILDPAQRADFADALEFRLHAVRMAILSGRRLDDLANALKLTDVQKQRIADDLKKLDATLEPERASIHKAIEAFRENTFAIDEVVPRSVVPERERTRTTLIIDLTEGLMNLLDQSQRERLADRIRDAAAVKATEPTREVAPAGDERLGEAAQAIWPWAPGPVWGRPWVGPWAPGPFWGPGFFYGRVAAFPYVAGWGFGW